MNDLKVGHLKVNNSLIANYDFNQKTRYNYSAFFYIPY